MILNIFFLSFFLVFLLLFRTVILWRNTRTLPSMSTMMVISGFSTAPDAVVAGISALMEPSAALQELLTVHSTCEQVQTTIFTVTATLKVTAITFKKERCEWDSGLESALQAISLLTPILVGIQGIVSSLRKYQKLSSKKESCDHLDFKTKTLDLCYDVMRFLKQLLFSSLFQLKNKVQKNPLLFWFILASSIFPLSVNKTVPFVGL